MHARMKVSGLCVSGLISLKKKIRRLSLDKHLNLPYYLPSKFLMPDIGTAVARISCSEHLVRFQLRYSSRPVGQGKK